MRQALKEVEPRRIEQPIDEGLTGPEAFDSGWPQRAHPSADGTSFKNQGVCTE